jgi:hypothetical protein
MAERLMLGSYISVRKIVLFVVQDVTEKFILKMYLISPETKSFMQG